MHPGDLIADRFEIVALAGAGGMGEVWKAQDHVSGEVVAVKVLRGAGGDPERFAREAMVLAELRHPGVVAYVAHGAQPDGSRYLAMEWLDGEDLEHLHAEDANGYWGRGRMMAAPGIEPPGTGAGSQVSRRFSDPSVEPGVQTSPPECAEEVDGEGHARLTAIG